MRKLISVRLLSARSTHNNQTDIGEVFKITMLYLRCSKILSNAENDSYLLRYCWL